MCTYIVIYTYNFGYVNGIYTYNYLYCTSVHKYFNLKELNPLKILIYCFIFRNFPLSFSELKQIVPPLASRHRNIS